MKPIYKKIYILTASACVFFLVLALGLFKYFHEVNEVHIPHFIQYNSYVAAQKDSSYILNFTYFIPKRGKEKLDLKSIQRIEFEKSNSVRIKDFKINEGSTTNKYKIRTLLFTVEFLKEGEEDINYIKIHFNDGSSESYKVGDWKFSISNLQQGKHLRQGERYPLATEQLVYYTLTLENLSDSEIKIEKLITGLKGIDFMFDSTVMDPGQSIRENVLPTMKDESNKETSFYYLRPLVQYSENGNNYCFYPDGVYFGLLNVNDDIIEKEILKTMNYVQ